MEATQSYPNLLSEKQAAKRLGVARITLLRAREAGRIRFFRIGTRVLYCAEQLTEFLAGCERNRHKQSREAESQAPRKENRVSSGRGSVGDGESARPKARSASRKKEQASLPFAASR
ncbi:MAG TPA: helix-turn-helix domain-containing protein [Pyrinomonadaceae bacterium]|nr:helix-turn-helix domain-containing protein [Pyrinomonadaceae bacterium]